jgi:hypothetical protein
MDNHTFLFENTNGSIYSNDLVLSIIEDASSSPPNSNGSLSPSSSNQSLDISSTTQISYPCCIFYCKPNSHPFQERCIPLNEQVKVGRAVARLKALPNNSIFDCKVLSRQHAKVWYEDGKVCQKKSREDGFNIIIFSSSYKIQKVRMVHLLIIND